MVNPTPLDLAQAIGDLVIIAFVCVCLYLVFTLFVPGPQRPENCKFVFSPFNLISIHPFFRACRLPEWDSQRAHNSCVVLMPL